jgi:hypothetical protein
MPKGKPNKKKSAAKALAPGTAVLPPALTHADRQLIQDTINEWEKAIENQDLVLSQRARLLLDHFEHNYDDSHASEEHNSHLAENPQYLDLVSRAEKLYDPWRKSLKVDDVAEYYFDKEDAWYKVKFIDYSKANKEFVIRFYGWTDPRYNISLSVENKEVLLNPDGTLLLSVKKPKPIVKEEEEEEEETEEKQKDEATDSLPQPMEVDEKPQQKGEDTKPNEAAVGASDDSEFPPLTKYGRIVRNRQSDPKNNNTPAKKTETKKSSSGKKKKAEPNAAEGEKGADFNDWKCTICNMLEADQNTELILCDGPCLRSYHKECLEANHIDFVPDGDWLCPDCEEGCHLCFVCNKRGQDYFVRGFLFFFLKIFLMIVSMLRMSLNAKRSFVVNIIIETVCLAMKHNLCLLKMYQRLYFCFLLLCFLLITFHIYFR